MVENDKLLEVWVGFLLQTLTWDLNFFGDEKLHGEGEERGKSFCLGGIQSGETIMKSSMVSQRTG